MSVREYRLHEAIKSWPSSDRPRERMMDLGAAYLSDSELLAIVIGSGAGKNNAIDVGRAVIKKFGGLSGVESASVDEIRSVPGMGVNKAAAVKAALELGRRFAAPSNAARARQIRTADDVYALCTAKMKNLKREIFSVMLLNSRHRLMKTVTVSEGALGGTVVHPREVFNSAIRESAHSVILAHNHPSGDPEPSEDDINLTRRLVEAGRLIGIGVVDHLIIGDGDYFSFANNDMI